LVFFGSGQKLWSPAANAKITEKGSRYLARETRNPWFLLILFIRSFCQVLRSGFFPRLKPNAQRPTPFSKSHSHFCLGLQMSNLPLYTGRHEDDFFTWVRRADPP
jgi:hypothetical protein